MMKRIIFIDVNALMMESDYNQGLSFVPAAITTLARLAEDGEFSKILINFSDKKPTTVPLLHSQEFLLKILAAEGWEFDEIITVDSIENGEAAIRQICSHYEVSLEATVCIGSSPMAWTLAELLSMQSICLLRNAPVKAVYKSSSSAKEVYNWQQIYECLKLGSRKIAYQRFTKETQISIQLNLDGNGKSEIKTGLGFFDHMLEQVARHSKCDLIIQVAGDLYTDEHHTIEDTGIALGESFGRALGDKLGLERYGFVLPMDEAAAQVLIDFGGRAELKWNAEFKREKIGDMPTEMFYHFFKSFADGAKSNLHIACNGINEHHKIEAIFKAFARAIRMAIKRDPFSNYLPSTKGIL